MTLVKSYLIAASRRGGSSSREASCGSGKGYTKWRRDAKVSVDSVTGMTGLLYFKLLGFSGTGCGRLSMSWKKGDAAARIVLWTWNSVGGFLERRMRSASSESNSQERDAFSGIICSIAMVVR